MSTVTFDELLNTPVSVLPQKTIVDAYYDGTKYMLEFSREVMIPVLGTLLAVRACDGQTREFSDLGNRVSIVVRAVA